MKNQALRIWHIVVLILAVTLPYGGACGQSASVAGSAATVSAVPPLVRFAGVAKSVGGEALTGTIGVTFLIYAEQQGGAPLWLETQNVQPDATGQYSVMLGATKAEGLPAALFVSGEARWLAVQISGQAEQARVLLLSVPYAMKAADADTVGGLPASAFLLATPATLAGAASSATSSGATSGAASQTAATSGVTPDAGAVTGSGTAGYLPLWTSASNLGNSGIFELSNGFIGIDTATPATGVDVANNMIVRGGFTMPPEGTATASTSYTSHSYYFQASAFNSAKNSAELQSFQWQAIPEGNNTATPSGVLNLRFAEGNASSVSTGFSIASNGILNFAAGQTFPGVPELGAGGNLTANSTNGSQALLGTSGNNVVPTVEGINSGSGPGVEGFSANTAVVGQAPNVGVYGASAGSSALGAGHGKAGVWGDTGYSSGGYSSGGYSSGGYYGVLGTADNNSAGGFYNNGAATTLIVENNGPYGGSGDAIHATTSYSDGVAVLGVSPNYRGVAGNAGTISANGEDNIIATAGVWGDTPGKDGFEYAVLGTTDNGTAGYFINNSDSEPTLRLTNTGTGGTGANVLVAVGASGSCSMNTSGDMGCTGKVSTAADVEGGARKVALYSVQSPENWFEDAGSGQLANGAARMEIDPTFAQTVNSGIGYHVFLTPNGDCKGLYITAKTATSFEVHELGGGTSNVAFDYRIMAKRLGFENVRLADVTAQIKKQAMPLRKSRPAALPTSAPKSTAARPANRLGSHTPSAPSALPATVRIPPLD
jgi:hypothetical protein